ncbi:MAG: AtpZ/AtpI family protein [Candidatus Margulisiibacteriota bacterium]
MNFIRYSDLAFSIAGSIVAPPLAGLLLGRFLDGRFGCSPAFTLALVLLGIAAGLRSLLRIAEKAGRSR